MIEVDPGEDPVLLFLAFRLDAEEDPHQQVGEPEGEFADRVEEVIEDGSGYGKNLQEEVRADPDDRLRQEVGKDQDNECCDDGLDDEDDDLRRNEICQPAFKEVGRDHTEDHRGDIDADEHR